MHTSRIESKPTREFFPMDSKIDRRKVKKKSQIVDMEDEYQQGPFDEGERRFTTLKVQVVDISKNFSLIMITLKRNINPFLEQLKTRESKKYHEEPRKEREKMNL